MAQANNVLPPAASPGERYLWRGWAHQPALVRGQFCLLPCMLVFLSACSSVGTGQAEKPVFSQVGIASWYGRDHQGHRTASGERFDMHSPTAAHRTLPFDTVVRVTRLDTGRAVTVRINDRGPYERGRVIDLSAAAARTLEIGNDGEAEVRIEEFRSDQPGATSAAAPQ
jgi:rare lipoprotein A (peptidoglycan hydrolase)